MHQHMLDHFTSCCYYLTPYKTLQSLSTNGLYLSSTWPNLFGVCNASYWLELKHLLHWHIQPTYILNICFLQHSASPAAGLGVGISVHQTVVTIHEVGEFLGLPNTPHFRHRDDTHTVTLQ